MGSKFVLLISVTVCHFSCDQVLNLEKEKQILLDTDKGFARKSLELGAAEAFRLYLDVNAMQLPAGSNPRYGLDSIYTIMKQSDGSYQLAWEPQQAEVSLSADMGWSWGRSTLIYSEEDGIQKKLYGKYLNVWKKQKDGSWKVLVDLGNQSPAPDDK